ncbi:cytochrome c oxidase accessory protein CcoG [Rhodocista pekingensis]|uniref:Cytochrome c oxidase accessory protein CcoG n=1 Tax=Rhodocista pekingensis TaxID=201185 RepID=A0ABW2KSZ3_9PROT
MDGKTDLMEKPAVAVRSRRQKPSADAVAAEQSLYASRVKVYPKAVTGAYRRAKTAVLVFCLSLYYLVPWIRWDRGPGAPDQAVLIDLSAGRAYFLWIEIWPQEVYYITGLLVLGAFGLFLVTALYGRIWCGYTCPQTVWTDLFMWVERVIEGDRGARMRLDQSPMSLKKAGLKTATHTAWLLISLATGGAWVLYFNDAPTFIVDFFTGAATVNQYFFVGLFTATTYLLAGWAREQVCTYMCPWPRFQAAMLDRDSMVVTYEKWRGEPRGGSKAGLAPEGLGDCIDCGQCIAACPTGIDIRDGLQLECIGCGLCIDACNDIMTKVGRPLNLVTFDTENNQEARSKGLPTKLRPVRPRTLIYAGLLLLVSAIMVAALATRTTMEVNVLRDRAPLFVTLSDGDIRNGYTLKILNKQRADVDYELSVVGIDGARLVVQDVGESDRGGPVVLRAQPDTVVPFRVFVTAPRGALTSDSTSIQFILRNPVDGTGDRYDAVFVGPRPAALH